MWFTVVVVFNGVNLEPEVLRSSTILYCQPCAAVLLFGGAVLLSIGTIVSKRGVVLRRAIRLTQNGDILTRLATLPNHQSPSYASTQCYIAKGSVYGSMIQWLRHGDTKVEGPRGT